MPWVQFFSVFRHQRGDLLGCQPAELRIGRFPKLFSQTQIVSKNQRVLFDRQRDIGLWRRRASGGCTPIILLRAHDAPRNFAEIPRIARLMLEAAAALLARLAVAERGCALRLLRALPGGPASASTRSIFCNCSRRTLSQS